MIECGWLVHPLTVKQLQLTASLLSAFYSFSSIQYTSLLWGPEERRHWCILPFGIVWLFSVSDCLFSQSLVHWHFFKTFLLIFPLCRCLLLCHVLSCVSPFVSLWFVGSWRAAVLFAVCMASLPGARNPLRYSLPSAMPFPGLASLLRPWGCDFEWWSVSLFFSTDLSVCCLVCACSLSLFPHPSRRLSLGSCRGPGNLL